MNNKLKVVGVTVLSSLALVGCNTNKDVGMNDNNGVQPTGYNDGYNNQVPYTDRINNMTNNLDRNHNNNALDLTNEDTYRDNNDNKNLNDFNNNNQNRFTVADDAANKITSQIPEVDNAYVLATDNNAYVAVGLDNQRGNGDISDNLKQRITDLVKQTDRDIDNVYISSNPDFVDLSNNYVNDVNNGKPVRGMFDQFSNMIQRIFPDTAR